MRSDEILKSQQLFEMSYNQKKAESVITGLEKPINYHLLKIWAMPDSEDRNHWIGEVVNWCYEISQIILKPSGRRPKKSFYFRILFDEPFGDAELPNIISRLAIIQRKGNKLDPSITPLDLLHRLEQFHKDFAERSEKAQVPEDEVRRLIG